MNPFDPFDPFGLNREPPKPYPSPESNYVPDVGSLFMIAWTSHRDNSYTDTVFECAATNQVSVVGKYCAGERLCKDKPLIFRLHQVRFYPVPPDYVDALNANTEETEQDQP